MRSPIFSTRPPATLSTRASSTVSAPVAGLVLITVTVWPTDFSSSFSWVSRSNSKFCSSSVSFSPSAWSSAVSGRIWPLTSMKAMLFRPWARDALRRSFTSARFSL